MNMNTICQALEQTRLPYLMTDSNFRILWRSSSLQKQYGWLNQSPTLDSLLFAYDKDELAQQLREKEEALTLRCRLPLLNVTISLSSLTIEEERVFLAALNPQPYSSLPQQSALEAFNQNLRAPVNQLFSMISMLNHRLEEDDLPYLQSMTRDCCRMLRSCISISEYSECLSGTAVLRRDYLDLNAWLKNLLEPAASMLERMNISFSFQSAEEPVFTAFDSEKLSVVLFSLLSNSCEFCEQSNDIRVSLRCGEKNAIITINDSGYGIPAELLQQVTEPYFSRGLDDSEQPGIGLGLPLARAIMELHGGSLALQSEQDKGTTVSLSLPLCREENVSALPLQTPDTAYSSDPYSMANIFLSNVLPPKEFQ